MDANKQLGPADEQAFFGKISDIFWKTKEDLIKNGPMTPKQIVEELQKAIATVLPSTEKGLGGLGGDDTMEVPEETEEEEDKE